MIVVFAARVKQHGQPGTNDKIDGAEKHQLKRVRRIFHGRKLGIILRNDLNSIMKLLDTIRGNIVDIPNRKIYSGQIFIQDRRIQHIEEIPEDPDLPFILPGFVDAHIHIESSMLVPYEFARKALAHGTIATISDPHEIANVCGLDGVYYMIENSKTAKLKFHFGAPSCVPATSFETAGAVLDDKAVLKLLESDDIYYLSEMMNYPGVLHGDEQVMKKIAHAQSLNKPVDGHAPGLKGDDARRYIEAGKENAVTISTDHECFTKAEALDKLKYGMKILIREGSAAKNFEALHELISEFPDKVMLCSDDKHPDDLLLGHINLLVKRALDKGHELFDVLQCACINPFLHYKMRNGILREGDAADFILVDNLNDWNILQTVIDGEVVAENGISCLPDKIHPLINQFNTSLKTPEQFALRSESEFIQVIEALDGQLITNKIKATAKIENDFAVSDTDNDILKIVVVNRYSDQKPAVAFIKNFGLKQGAIASTVAHDSHNIIAVGVNDEDICRAVNILIENTGGLSCVNGDLQITIALPVAGLMSDQPCEVIGKAYSEIDAMAKSLGCTLHAPYMTLSFMALLVIPSLKLSDLGLFDGYRFEFEKIFI
jgi:adenine deaminase